jgi:hypothetical protein
MPNQSEIRALARAVQDMSAVTYHFAANGESVTLERHAALNELAVKLVQVLEGRDDSEFGYL